MLDHRIDEIVRMLRPEKGARLWFGGASPGGCLRGVSPEAAGWKPGPSRHSVWELSLHIAYWEYAVRRILDDLPSGGFSRSPSDWPAVPESRSEGEWKVDRALARREHEALTEAIRAFDPRRLDDLAPGSGSYRCIDLMHGAIMHSTYHTGQIQLAKRLFAERSSRE
jgi:uncharacterized damage-inducible protein DinB